MIHNLIKKVAPGIYVLLSKLNGFPLFIQIETTGVCNLRCSMCEYSSNKSKNKNRMIDFDRFEKLFNTIFKSSSFIFRKIFPKSLLFDLTGIGEPFMNKDFLRFVKLLKEKGLTVTFASNFTLLNENIIKDLIDYKVDLIFVSLDGATKKSYESIRKGADFDKVINNLRKFVIIKGNKKPKLVIRFLVSSLNVKDMPLLVELAKDIGIKNLSITRMNTSDQNKELQVDPDDYKKYKELAVNKAKELGIELDFGLFSKKPIRKCKRSFNSMFITYEGYVLPCCFVNQGGKYEEIKRLYNFGNVFERNIKEIWDDDKYKQFRKMIAKNKVPAVCKDCYLFY